MDKQTEQEFYYNLAIENLPKSIIDFWKINKSYFQLINEMPDAGVHSKSIYVFDGASKIIGMYFFDTLKWTFLFDAKVFSEENYIRIINLKSFT